MTELSRRSRIASSGVVSSAQSRQARTSTNRTSARKRFRSDASISQLTMSPPCETLVVRQRACAAPDRRHAVTRRTRAANQRSVRGQTTSYAEWRTGLGGGSVSARGTLARSSGARGDTSAMVAGITGLTAALVVRQDEEPHQPSHIAPKTMQSPHAKTNGAERPAKTKATTAAGGRNAPRG